MTKYVTVALILCACALLTTAQFNHLGLGFSDGYLATNFGPPSLNALSAAAARDPRANTGPVVFPPSPPGDPSQTSGVVPGASGYGFQPPSPQGSGVPRYFYRGFYRRR
ncbi:uncharacterized protein LOC125066288 [Vanessa atalanta]|uniref:uncharacterized protein LOC125066288 n=1 Tax=Vanessa atalanta TaxID=42275 RepID=UPI000E77BA7C|nr:uncharacterized protein LOC113404861 [Vanessa tameamea]XP_047530272.1 uncharacterized protein LOC125066288 [Vanessa atalanta]